MATNSAGLRIDEARLEATVMPQLETFAAAFVRRVEVQAKALAPVRTGNLKAGIHADAVRRVGPWRIESGISSDADYSAPVHEGARPHVIRPKHARVLRFEINGRTIFAARVNHPGQRAQPYLRNAVHRVASADPRIDLGER